MTRRCSEEGCNTRIAPWNMSGKCSPCQKGKIIGEGPMLSQAFNEDVSPMEAIRIATGVRHE
jgi:hypothetical protein